ncbi:MAG: hypothetical protein IPN53_14640 [Comamonadaceae bacterium]|nr:hypothetical protein [Comamonadaceae bacterium]
MFEGFAQILATAFVLDQQRAFPQQVEIAFFAADFLDTLLKGGHFAALDAKDLKKFIPEAFGIGLLTFDMLPIV